MKISLFPEVDDIKPGQVWVDIDIERSGQPDPMATVVVKEIDDVGMIVIQSSIFGDANNKPPLSPDSFRKKYRLKSEV